MKAKRRSSMRCMCGEIMSYNWQEQAAREREQLVAALEAALKPVLRKRPNFGRKSIRQAAHVVAALVEWHV